MPPAEIIQPATALTPRATGAAGASAHVAARYTATRVDGTEAVLAAIAAHENAGPALAFQRLAWLRPLYKTLAPDLGAKALGVVVTDAESGELALLLPLVETRAGRLSIIAWAALGVCDYGAPILGPKAPARAEECATLWAAVKRTLKGFDVIELGHMPKVVDGRLNPLASLKGCVPARHCRHALTLPGTVEEFLISRGKKYRKEAERCTRLLAERGEPEFKRAQTEAEISEAYATLEHQQRQRHAARGNSYQLDQAAFAKFFKVALMAGAADRSAHIFTLKAGGETGAVLYGISDQSTFTLLRISTAGESWKRVSPGRLIVLDTMRYFLAKGIKSFDMGIGEYEFKHGFGIESEPLVDITAALSLRGLPRAALARALAKARQHPRLVDAAKRVLGRG